MRKLIALFVSTIMLLTFTACGIRTSTVEQITERTYDIQETTKDPYKPFISKESDCMYGTNRGRYNVVAEGYGVIGSGKGYCELEKATQNPLEVTSHGKAITVTLAEDSVDTKTFKPGEAAILKCDSGSFTGYLYVVVI